MISKWLLHTVNRNTARISFLCNGQNTTQGGTHQAAFREAYVKTIREFFGKNYDASDIRKSIIAPSVLKWWNRFESQTKTKLGSTEMGDDAECRAYVNDFLGTQLDNFLHKNQEIAASIQRKILQAEKSERNFRVFAN